MRENDFKNAYAEIQERIIATKDFKLSLIQALDAASQSCQKEARLRTESGKTRRAFPLFNRLRTGEASFASRRRVIAVGACVVLIVAVGATMCIPKGMPALSPIIKNDFVLSAYADEQRNEGAEPRVVALDKFYPVRTGAGYSYDEISHSPNKEKVVVSRSYMFDMTLEGQSIESVTYKIEGDGVSYGSWKNSPSNIGVAEESDLKSFTVPFVDEMPMIREISLNYDLDASEKSRFGELYKAGDIDGTELLIAEADAARLSRTKVTAEVTFTDGAKISRSYSFVPAESYSSAYAGYLNLSRGNNGETDRTSLDSIPSLFSLVEV